MPTKAAPEAARSRHTIFDKRFAPVVPFLNQRLAYPKPVTFDGGASIGSHAYLREARALLCQLLGLLASSPFGSGALAQANVQTLLRRHFTPRENDLQRAALTDDPRQPHSSPVNQRHTPTATIDAEVRILRHHLEVAP
jgi:hypothetical protein